MCVASRILPLGDGPPSQVKVASVEAYFSDLTASREPIIRSYFDVYISDGSLIYAKPKCSQADVEGRLFANIYPIDNDDLPVHLRQRGYETIDFNFANYGTFSDDGNCWASLALPNYPIAEIHAGQYAELADGYVHIWEATHRFSK